MTARRVPISPTDDLLAELGLPPGAPSEDAEAAHAAVVAFLATAPASIRGWAHGRAAAADEALLLLTDPTASVRPTLSGLPKPVATRPGGPATPPVRRAAPVPRPVPAPPAVDEALDEETLFASVTPSLHRDEAPGPRLAGGPSATPAGGRRRVPSFVRNLAIVAIVASGVMTIAAVGYNMGGSGAPAPTQPPAAAVPSAPALDQAAVADLMARVQANPADTESLLLLADEFYAVGQWTSAQTWLDKLLKVDPESIRGLLAAGATSFNLGDFEAAEARWLRVVELDEDNLEAHYDLGFLYLNAEPADLAAVAREWGRVVEIDPDSELAKIVSMHLSALIPTPAPSGAPASPASPGPSSSPAASPVASPAAPEVPAP